MKIVFVILLVVTFGEAAYYVYYQFGIKNNQLSSQDTTVTSTRDIPQVTPVNSVDNCTLGKQLYNSMKTEQSPTDALIDAKTIEYLKTFKRNKNQKASLVLEVKGSISDIIYHEGGYALLRLVDGEGKKITDVSVRVNEDKPIFFKMTGTGNQPLSLKEVKKGNNVIYKSQLDLSTTQGSNYEFLIE